MMERILKLSLLLLVLLMPATANAYDFVVDGIYYNDNQNGNSVSVTYGDNKYSGVVVVPESITHDGKTYSVTAIGAYAFRDCYDLTGVNLPNTVTKIEDYAFTHCASLSQVNIPNAVEAIGKGAFAECSGLSSIEIPNSVTTLDNFSFIGCTGITRINIPNSVNHIGLYAFANCTGLTSFTIPSSVQAISSRILSNCYNLQSVNIPNSVKTIDIEAFYGCSGLTSIELPNSITTILGSAFTGCSGLTSITLPNSITAISDRMFSHCTSLKSVTIPNTVTSIGKGAFKKCVSLTNVTIPNSVTHIDGWTFMDCTGLTEVTIPESVDSIPYCAFAGCSALKHIQCLSTTPPVMYSDFTFEDNIYKTARISVPASAISAYRGADGWKRFTSIEDLDGTLNGDVNNDRQVNISDINAVINLILSPTTFIPAADVNQDGTINISDINAVIDKIFNPGGNNRAMQIWLTNGSISSFALTDRPKMTCVTDSLIITTTKGRYSFNVYNVRKITYAKSGNSNPINTPLKGLTGNQVRHLTIHFKNGNFSTIYLENLCQLSTLTSSSNGGQYELVVDGRDEKHNYALNEIDSISFGSTSTPSSQTQYQPISLTYLKPINILPIIGHIDIGNRNFYDERGLNDIRIAEAVHIVDMMWKHGGGDYSIEQYQQLMDKLCYCVMNELPLDENAPIEIFLDPNMPFDANYFRTDHGSMVWDVSFSLMKHAHFYGPYIYTQFVNSNPDKIVILGESMFGSTHTRSSIDRGLSNGLPKGLSFAQSENLVYYHTSSNIGVNDDGQVLRKAFHIETFGGNDFSPNFGIYTNVTSNGVHDKTLDSHTLVSHGTLLPNDKDITHYTSGGCKFHVGFNPDVLFIGLPFPYKSPKSGKVWVDDITYSSLATPFVEVSAALCFQMKADIKSADELLDLLRSTASTDTLWHQDEMSVLKLINPKAFILRYLMPQSLPTTVGEGPYVHLEKGFYKGIIFDIPGAEVYIDGEWIPADDTFKQFIKAQDPFTLEWRLNVPKLVSMGYSNNAIIPGRVIFVDDQFKGLNIIKDFSIKLTLN